MDDLSAGQSLRHPGLGPERQRGGENVPRGSGFLAEDWRPIFECNGLSSFEGFWDYKADWFEPPNQRRGGWSGVARCSLRLPQGGETVVFLKRQENHVTRTWRHPIRGMATLIREFDNLTRFADYGIPTLRPVYFAVRRICGRLRAILITEELSGFCSLESLVRGWDRTGWPVLAERRRIIAAVALVVRRMHDHGARHNCLYAKHIFVRWTPCHPPGSPLSVEVRIIDLEKSKWTRSSWRAGRKDLDTLHRHSGHWRRTDRWRFLKVYLGDNHPVSVKAAWHILAKRARRKLAKKDRKDRRQTGVS